MATLVQLINNVVSLSVLEVMKNAVFIEDEAAGGLKLDITKLPSHLQTMSAENIKAEFATMQGTAQGNIQQAEMTQQQIAQLSQQSAMSGAMQRLMQDESLIDKAGETAGKFMGNFLKLRDDNMDERRYMPSGVAASTLDVLNPTRSVTVDMIMVQFLSAILAILVIILFKGQTLGSSTASYLMLAMIASIIMLSTVYTRITK